MNVMSIDGYHARIDYDSELDLFRGEILGLTGGADFYGKNPKELRVEFRRSLKVFLDVCREKGMSHAGIFREDSIFVSHPSFMNGLLLPHKPKARV